MKAASNQLRKTHTALAAGLLLCLLPETTRAEPSITEPATVFYGKVTGTGSAQPFLITEGELRWTIRRPDGVRVPLRAPLFELDAGEKQFSYRLDVPHEALVSGQQISEGTVPLAEGDAIQTHAAITFEGLPATIAGSGKSTFDVSQARRAATYRLDLEVDMPAVDSDGDGMPDWWEEKYGFDPDSANASGDFDGDGATDLAEYFAGSDPTVDSRRPRLLSSEFLVYAGGTTGLALRVSDIDSEPESIRYTLAREPGAGALMLRNGNEDPSAPDTQLGTGDTFSQADVEGGRLIYRHGENGSLTLNFELAVSDENPEHGSSPGEIELTVYSAELDGETGEEELAEIGAMGALPTGFSGADWRVRNYILSRESGFVVWELGGDAPAPSLSSPSSGLHELDYTLHYVPKFGRERQFVIVGGAADDRITAGMEDDIIYGGPGDDELDGGGGRDFFVYRRGDLGHDRISGFGFDESGTIDLSQILVGQSTQLADYVRVAGETSLTIEVDMDGSAASYADLSITLEGIAADQFDLYDLVEAGALVSGGLELTPRISVAAGSTSPSEHELRPGVFTLTRAGELGAELAVNLAVTGSAQNGLDYSAIGQTVTFPAGAKTVSIGVVPFADNVSEPAEVVEVTLLPGTGYELGADKRATLVIEDLKMLIAIEPLEPKAVVAPLSSAYFLVRRTAVTDRSVVIMLQIGGSATNGDDYERISRFVEMSAGQTSALVEVAPRAGAVLEGGAESVAIEIAPDAAYAMGEQSLAKVIIIDGESSIESWREAEFPGAQGDLLNFAAADPGVTGISNLLRYAFGMGTGNSDRAMLPRPVLRDGALTVDVRHRAEAGDVEIIVEATSDLRVWDSSPASVEEIFPPEHRDDARIRSYRAVKSTPGPAPAYLRVRVQLKQ